MRADYDKLLDYLCVDLGFCGSVVNDQPSCADQFLPDSGPLTAEDFASAVFKAEGWDPDGARAREFRSRIREAFVRHMGLSAIDVSLLR